MVSSSEHANLDVESTNAARSTLRPTNKDSLVFEALEAALRDTVKVVLETVLDLEARAYVLAHRDHRDARGRALVVANGVGRLREVRVGAYRVQVRAPRVNDRRVESGGRRRFVSAVLPPFRSARLGSHPELIAACLTALARGAAYPIIERLRSAEVPNAPMAARAVTELIDGLLQAPLADLAVAELIAANDVRLSTLLDPNPRLALALVAVLPSGRPLLVGLTEGDPSSPVEWRRLLDRCCARGLRPAPTLSGCDAFLEAARSFAAGGVQAE